MTISKENMIKELLYSAAMKGDLPKLNEFLNSHTYETDTCAMAVWYGVIGGNFALIERLLEIPAVPEYCTQIMLPLEEAAKRGNMAVLERLLQIPQMQERAHANFNDALQKASANGHLAIVERLLQIPLVQATAHSSCSTTHGRNSALQKAAENGHTAIVKRLLQIPQVRDSVSTVKDNSNSTKFVNVIADALNEVHTSTSTAKAQASN